MFKRKPKQPALITAPAPDRLSMIWVTISMTIVLLPHLPRLPLWYPVLFVLAAAQRLAEVHKVRKPIPGWIKLPLALLTVIGLLTHYGTIFGRQAGVALLCVMLAMKLLESHRRRDIYLLITISYFVIVTQFLFDQSIGLVVYLLAGVIVITGSLIVVELQPSREHGDSSAKHINEIGGLIQNSGKLLAQSLPLMLVLFVFFPRLSTPIWGVPNDALDNRTGIGDEMSPGKISELFVSDDPAFRAYFKDSPMPQGQSYWRGPVLWDFDGSTWRRPASIGLRNRPARIDQSRVSENAIRYEVIMEPTERVWAFGLDVPVGSLSQGRIQQDHTMYKYAPITDLFSYEMVSDANYVLDPELTPLQRRYALAIPDGFNPRTVELARQWRAELGNDPIAIANRALRMFTEEEFFYSFRPPPLGRHTVDDFLFKTRNGFCEFYSSSFTFLMRAAGVPARVVTGYLGGYPNGDYLLIRQSDAHAWSEIWVEGRGWIRYDPTAAVAPERIDQGALEALGSRSALDFGWLRSLRNQLDSVHSFWNKVVLKFNFAKQRELFRPLGIDDFDPHYGLIVVIVLGAGLSAVLFYWLIRVQQLGGLDPASRHYAVFRKKLSKAGVKSAASEGPRDLAERASQTLSQNAGEIQQISQLYIQLRYQPIADKQTLQELQKAVKQFKPAA